MSEQDKLCYEIHRDENTGCENKSCRYNFKNAGTNNCVLLAAHVQHTLQEIGDMYGVTRMRICQIEKRALQKLMARSRFE